jgi:hypothetical protein
MHPDEQRVPGPLSSPEDPVNAGDTESASQPSPVADPAAARRRPNLTSLVAGIGLVALGVLLALESEGVLEVGLRYIWPALLAVGGATLLASGLERRRR